MALTVSDEVNICPLTLSITALNIMSTMTLNGEHSYAEYSYVEYSYAEYG